MCHYPDSILKDVEVDLGPELWEQEDWSHAPCGENIVFPTDYIDPSEVAESCLQPRLSADNDWADYC